MAGGAFCAVCIARRRAELRIPTTEPVVSMRVEFDGAGPELDPHWLALLGVPRRGAVSGAEVPRWEEPNGHVELRLQRVHAYAGSGVYERQWHPTTGFRDMYPEPLASTADWRRARLGRDLLNSAGRRRGRPPGTVSMPDFPARFAEAYAHCAQGGRHPTQRRVAMELELPIETFRRHLRDFDLVWPPNF